MENNNHGIESLTNNQLVILLVSVFVVALCGIAYELIIAHVSTILLGNSVYQYSMTIGFFMFAMGIGSLLTRRIHDKLIERFVIIEIIISIFGGFSSTILYYIRPYENFYSPIMFSLIIIIGIMVGLEIPILTRILSYKDRIKDSIANVLALDYLGALVGSVSFPLLFLPYLDIFGSPFAFALMNSAVAFINVVAFRKQIKAKWFWKILTIFVLVSMLVGLVSTNMLRQFLSNRLFADLIIYQKQTVYQQITLTQNLIGTHLRLYLDGHIQFSEKDEYRYHEALVHPIMSLPGERKRVLILGGGDGMAAREILKYPDVEEIHLVDIDPEVTRLCRTLNPIVEINEGSLDNDMVKVFNEDAFNFVQRKRGYYNRVIIDLPDPHNDVLSKLYSVEFYQLIKRAMKEDGYIVTQSSSPYYTTKVFWCIAKTMDQAGFKTLSYKIHLPSFGMWGFNLASAKNEFPQRFQFEVETKFITPEVMTAAEVFGKDIAKVKTEANYTTRPIIYKFYIDGIHKSR